MNEYKVYCHLVYGWKLGCVKCIILYHYIDEF